MQATITSKGQVTLPKPIRDKLHLRAGDKIDFLVDAEGNLRVVPVTAPVTALKGMLPKPEVPVTLEDMDRAIAQAATRRS
ncbi:MAG: AbrB/MazE/SpoVT family DNA-binding domain-containing protein [Acidobacteria bacterium]|nr:AbrB/MazE/SpoVT family DNA-binding domain-containing protein [Acidobacteriota bacterium]